MIKAIVFDLDNTLYSYDAAHTVAFQAVSEYACLTFGLTAEAFRALHQKGVLQQQAGPLTAAVHNRLIRYQIMLENLGQPILHAPEMAGIYWSAFLSAMEPGPGLYECLDYLKSHHYVVGIGTNMTADYQYAKLKRLDILDRIDFIVSSEETGVEKPDRRLFDCCTKKAGCLAGACAFVGDSLENDAQGALNAGMIPVWLSLEPGECSKEIQRISSLTELPALLESLMCR